MESRRRHNARTAEPSAEPSAEPLEKIAEFEESITLDYDAIKSEPQWQVSKLEHLQDASELLTPFTISAETGTINMMRWDRYDDPPRMLGKRVVMNSYYSAITDGVTVVSPRACIERHGNIFSSGRGIIGWVGKKPTWPTAGLLVPTQDLVPKPTSLVDAWIECPLELVAIIEEYMPNNLYAGAIAYCAYPELCPTHTPIHVGKHLCAIQGELLDPPMDDMPPGEMVGETFVVSVSKFPCTNFAGEGVFDRFCQQGQEPMHFSNHDVMFGQRGTLFIVRRSDARWCMVKNSHMFIRITD